MTQLRQFALYAFMSRVYPRSRWSTFLMPSAEAAARIGLTTPSPHRILRFWGHPACKRDKNNWQRRNCEPCKVAASEYGIVVGKNQDQIWNREQNLHWIVSGVVSKLWIEEHGHCSC